MFQCDSKFHFSFGIHQCEDSFQTEEELIFHQKHDCIFETDKMCPEFKFELYCHCIEELKKKINHPILFPCHKCKLNFDSSLKCIYHVVKCKIN